MMKKYLSIFLAILLLGIGLTVYAVDSDFKYLGDYLIFRVDNDVFIEAPSSLYFELKELTPEEANVELESYLDKGLSTVEFILDNGRVVTYAEKNGNFYNLPLVDSPDLVGSKKKGYYFLVDDSLYMFTSEMKQPREISSSSYNGFTKEELYKVDEHLFWIDQIKLSNDENALYFISNRRYVESKVQNNYDPNELENIDLWKYNLDTGEENLVLKGGFIHLFDDESKLLASRFSGNQKDLVLIEDGVVKEITEDIELSLGGDRYSVYFTKGLSLYKFDVINEELTVILDLSKYANGGAITSPNKEISIIMTVNKDTGEEGVLLNTKSEYFHIDLPIGFTVWESHWAGDQRLIISGILNEKQEISYELDLTKYLGKESE